jgi:hypothetical protein
MTNSHYIKFEFNLELTHEEYIRYLELLRERKIAPLLEDLRKITTNFNAELTQYTSSGTNETIKISDYKTYSPKLFEQQLSTPSDPDCV